MRREKFLPSSFARPASESARRARSRPVSEYRRPESVLVVVYSDDLDILLLKRRQPFTFWQSITGSLDTGETPVETAARELHEETGISDPGPLVATGIERTFTIDPRWLDRYAPGTTENREHEFRIRIARDRAIRIDPTEHSDWRWVPVDEAIELVWSWTNRDALKALRESCRSLGRAPTTSP